MKYLLLLLFLSGCASNEEHPRGSPITRLSHSKEYDFRVPCKRGAPVYPWARPSPPPITKHYFRCRGCNAPPYVHEGETIKDCGGFLKHSLPMREGEEFIYPILIDLLNYIQDRTGKKVIITSGHRCPRHNAYLDPSIENQTSKHLIGGEVSFYVEGMEGEPMTIVNMLQEYYSGGEYATFRRYEGRTNVSTAPWMNKEILIKLFLREEGRNCDNGHEFPYISVQVRHDRERGEPVIYTWGRANRGFYQK